MSNVVGASLLEGLEAMVLDRSKNFSQWSTTVLSHLMYNFVHSMFVANSYLKAVTAHVNGQVLT